MNDKKQVEREVFSARLKNCLTKAGYSPNSPTALMVGFNARFDGHSITVHAARKWLLGEAIPTQEKLQALAQWLGVSAEWLRFGTGEPNKKAPRPAGPVSERILSDLKLLDEKSQRIAHEMIRSLVRFSTAEHG